MQLTDLNLEDLMLGLKEGRFTSLQITEAYLQRIEATEPYLNAYITVVADQAIAAAKAADDRRANNQLLSDLDGIPVALKDIFCTDGVLTSCASKMLYNYLPPYNATCWQKLLDAGCILLGKTNMDEFAMGSSNENSAYGAAHNPFDIDYVTGGSSGGSAAVVAADSAPFALGTDTGGSVRQPAHYCGVVGIKPTYGRISRFGIIPFASSLDQAGIFAKTVRDSAIILEAVSGKDKMDSTSADVAVGNYRAACDQSVKGLKIGLPKEFLAEGIEPATLEAIANAAQILRDAGAIVEEISLPHTPYALPAYYVLSSAEASSNLARYDGVRYGYRAEADDLNQMFIKTRTEAFGEEVKRRIMLGTYALSSGYYDAYYNKTLQVRTLIKQDYDQIFAAGYDALLTPVTAGCAFKINERSADPLAMYMTDVCTVPINLAGLCAISVPFTMVDGLPLGLQLIGKPFGEEALYTAAAAIEQPRFLAPDFSQTGKGGL